MEVVAIAVGDRYGWLQHINLAYCCQLTDAGILALGDGCDQLQSINLTHCNQVTDADVIA